ncbi:hypothetical protein SELMODRAFT_407337 [Selaginella moellendorffii]|uniref:Uncharacterized protein n=1 Tax=Selaginella moellendorffii TaxID=88036 RepID=D8R4Q2_SELML|nr:hypothetical protein SELMODRAFT_407337 [Selaginella moellendorffii]
MADAERDHEPLQSKSRLEGCIPDAEEIIDYCNDIVSAGVFAGHASGKWHLFVSNVFTRKNTTLLLMSLLSHVISDSDRVIVASVTFSLALLHNGALMGSKSDEKLFGGEDTLDVCDYSTLAVESEKTVDGRKLRVCSATRNDRNAKCNSFVRMQEVASTTLHRSNVVLCCGKYFLTISCTVTTAASKYGLRSLGEHQISPSQNGKHQGVIKVLGVHGGQHLEILPEANLMSIISPNRRSVETSLVDAETAAYT